MKKSVTIAMFFWISLAAGCSGGKGKITDGGTAPELGASTIAAGADGTSPSGVEGARTWRTKFSNLSERYIKLQGEKFELITKNRELRAQMTALQKELKQTNEEVRQANDMMILLNKELRKWKGDVLDFRGEMQKAQLAQIDLLKKIVVLVGGEIPNTVAEKADKLASKE